MVGYGRGLSGVFVRGLLTGGGLCPTPVTLTAAFLKFCKVNLCRVNSVFVLQCKWPYGPFAFNEID